MLNSINVSVYAVSECFFDAVNTIQSNSLKRPLKNESTNIPCFSTHSLFGINNSVLFGCFISEEVKELVISSVNRITSLYYRALVRISMQGGQIIIIFELAVRLRTSGASKNRYSSRFFLHLSYLLLYSALLDVGSLRFDDFFDKFFEYFL